MTHIEITLTARVRVDANEWAYEHGVPLEDVADHVRRYVRANCEADRHHMITLAWK